jgi:anti-anti-sigma factor
MTANRQHPSGLTVDVARQDDTVTIALAGEFDLATRSKVERALVPMASGERLVVDLTGLSFIDSTGIRILMELDVRARMDGWTLVIARTPGGPVQRVLDLCNVSDRVLIVDDQAAAG